MSLASEMGAGASEEECGGEDRAGRRGKIQKQEEEVRERRQNNHQSRGDVKRKDR